MGSPLSPASGSFRFQPDMGASEVSPQNAAAGEGLASQEASTLSSTASTDTTSTDTSKSFCSTISDCISWFFDVICKCLAQIPCIGGFFTNLDSEVSAVSDSEVPAEIANPALEQMWAIICRQIPEELIPRGSLNTAMSALEIRTLLETKPDWVTKITVLDFSQQGFTVLPPEIGYFSSLRDLDLSRNQLTVLPPTIGQLKSLEELNLRSNQLTALPPTIGQLRSLKLLHLGSNQLETFPPEIRQLESLTSLWLCNNRFQVFPSEIEGLTSLETLDFSYNQLRVFPPQIFETGQLKHTLSVLILNHNQLQTLPVVIKDFKNLRSLSLVRNKFSTLPEEISLLHRDCLDRLLLADNPLDEESLPQAIKERLSNGTINRKNLCWT